MQPLLGFQSVSGHLLQCLFDKAVFPFFPLEVLVSIADCPVRLCFLCDCPIFSPFFSFFVFLFVLLLYFCGASCL